MRHKDTKSQRNTRRILNATSCLRALVAIIKIAPMIIHYNTTSATHIVNALVRYFKYCLNISITKSSDISLLQNAEIIIVIDNNIDLLLFCSSIHGIKKTPNAIRFKGYEKYCDVNLFEFDSLKKQFSVCFEPRNKTNFINIPFVQKRLTTFFKGHGEESILGCIGWVNYYVNNYNNLSKTGEYSPQGLYDTYFLQGINYWNEFTRRFTKHAPIMYTAGWDKETLKIEEFIKIVTSDLNKFEKPDSFFKFGNDSLSAISEITQLIEDMEKQVNRACNETKPPNS